ncbi:MAG TPA: alternative ribosome rescue aminoacyl-tRNA hydrolase ArfB [Anaerolineae bacterium]|nr:alternative ribosome rescue aminoacyl-tRNA hydrolase ArfB [Anaerolineae bacterium]HMR62924.1 alternative ribosome rescue aminoacyl-tRNA hydrolase ArfB [Anaerolineae bacterium]
MIEVTSKLAIDEDELQIEASRSSGPGGQNVNKVATAIQLRFDVTGSKNLPPEVKERLIRLAGQRMTKEGVLLIEARRFRTQERNRQDALERLIELIRRAAKRPSPRRPTKPSSASQAKRRAEKQQRSQTKRLRRWSENSEE